MWQHSKLHSCSLSFHSWRVFNPHTFKVSRLSDKTDIGMCLYYMHRSKSPVHTVMVSDALPWWPTAILILTQTCCTVFHFGSDESHDMLKWQHNFATLSSRTFRRCSYTLSEAVVVYILHLSAVIRAAAGCFWHCLGILREMRSLPAGHWLRQTAYLNN